MNSRARTPLCGRSANSWVLHDQSTSQGKLNLRTHYRWAQTEGLHCCHHHCTAVITIARLSSPLHGCHHHCTAVITIARLSSPFHGCHHLRLSLWLIHVEKPRSYVARDQSTRRLHPRRQISHCCYSFRCADTVIADCGVQ